MTDRACRLQQRHPPAPPGQRPCGGEAEQPRADHDATAVLGHGDDHRNGSARRLGPAREGPRCTLGGSDGRESRVDAPQVRHARHARGPRPFRRRHRRRHRRCRRGRAGARGATGPDPTRPRQPRSPGGACRRLPRGRHRLLRRAGRRAVVARLVGAPVVDAHVRLRRPGAAGLVHGLARLGHGAPAQPVLLRRGQRARRRQPAVEHLGDAGGRRARPGDVALRAGRVHQRRAHPRSRPQRVGLLRRHPPACDVEARRHPGRAGVRLLVGHRHVAGLRPRVGDHARDPAVPLHHAARDRHPTATFGAARRARPGRPAGGAVLDFARGAGHVRAVGPSWGCWRCWRWVGARCGGGRATPGAPSAWASGSLRCCWPIRPGTAWPGPRP